MRYFSKAMLVASAVLCLNLSAYSQNISLKINDLTVKQAMEQLKKNTGYSFVFSLSDVDTNKRVSVSAENTTIEDVVNQILKGQEGLKYEIRGKKIVLSKFQQEEPQKSEQKKQIKGRVIDEKGDPIIGAAVLEECTNNGTITDFEGNFILKINEGKSVEISYLGYDTQKVKVIGNKDLSVILKENTELLDEVVVIGYGTVKKSDLTGAVASVSSKQFKEQPVKRVSDILQGRTTGVSVTNVDGMPGGSVKIRVRGTTSINTGNDPLYVVDGIVGGGIDINPADIQSIEILKDASATAIYGSRGANGVVLITTKKGTEGKVNIFADATIGVSNIVKKYDLLNPYEYATALNDYRGSSTISSEDMEAYKNGTKGIDWQNLMLQTGISQDYKVGFSGGTARSKYYISANYLDMTAMTITTKYQRGQLRINLDNQLNDRFSIATKLHFSYSHRHNGDIDIMNFINYSPTMEMIDENTGIYNKDPFNAVDQNPYGKLMENYDDSYAYNLNASIDLRYKILDGLIFSSQTGINYSNNPYYSFVSSKTAPGQLSGMSNTSSLGIFWQNVNNLTYDKTFGDHHLTATAVFEESGYEGKSMSIKGTDLNNEFVGYWNVKNAKNIEADNGYSAYALVSALARVMYSYKGKFLFTGSIRADGSSKFSKGNKWGYFPSAAVAWDIAKENFMLKQDIFRQLKLRGSFGVVGNQNIAPYSTLGMLASKDYDPWGAGQKVSGYWSGNLATPNVTWESTYQYNIGLDASVLDGRLNFTVEWFRKDTKDLLLRKPAPLYNGGGSFWVNQGEIRNSGFELSVNAVPFQNKDWLWDTSFNASYLKNEIIDLAGDEFIVGDNYTGFGGGPIVIKKVGYPVESFYVYEWANFNDKGANLYVRQSDKSYTTNPTSEDLIVKGQAEPKWTFGWNNTVTWKNWTFNCFFNAAVGHNRLNMSRFTLTSMIGKYRFISLADAYYKGWDKVENKADAKYASHSNSDNKNYPDSDFWLEDASYIKLKNISLAYTFPRKMTKFADIQLSFSAQNVFTLTRYTGMDPEVYNGGPNEYNGVDLGAYPVPRTFSFGMKLNF